MAPHPRCRHCGRKIHRQFDAVTFGPVQHCYGYVRPRDFPTALPGSRAEAARVSGKRIEHVKWWRPPYGDTSEVAYIAVGYVWNGRYADPHFCKRWACPHQFGRLAAQHTDLLGYEAA